MSPAVGRTTSLRTVLTASKQYSQAVFFVRHAGLDPASSDFSVLRRIYLGEKATSPDTGFRRYDRVKMIMRPLIIAWSLRAGI
jgi:hypothetical protein